MAIESEKGFVVVFVLKDYIKVQPGDTTLKGPFGKIPHALSGFTLSRK